jgi:hypothetical protein
LAMIFTGDGSFGKNSTTNCPICPNSDSRSGENGPNQEAVSTHGESGAKNPVDILFLGTVYKVEIAAGTGSEGATGLEDKHGVRITLSVKSDLRIGQSDVDG